MRWWLQKFLPIAIFAITMQAFSPVFAFAGFSSGQGDAVGRAMLCSAMAQNGGAEDAPQSQDGDALACCILCAPHVAHAIPPEPSDTSFLTIERALLPVSWAERDQIPPVRRSGLNAQARAPPVQVPVHG